MTTQPHYTIEEHVPLAPLTSWRIGGTARYLATVRSPAGLAAVVAFADTQRLPVWILGGGSNILVADAGLPGVVIRMRDVSIDITENADTAAVTIGAGAPMAGTVRRLVHAGWAGISWAEGLPGTFGGAVYGNAGCYGGAMADTVQSVQLWVDGTVQSVSPATLGFRYRTSRLKHDAEPQQASGMHVGDLAPVVVAAVLSLQSADPAVLAAQVTETAALRRSKTPQGSSCGSVFKNPPNDAAGRLIEAAGLKGYAVGAAQVAEKHANYIINHGGATSADVCALVAHIRATVAAHSGVILEPEVQLLGTRWPFSV